MLPFPDHPPLTSGFTATHRSSLLARSSFEGCSCLSQEDKGQLPRAPLSMISFLRASLLLAALAVASCGDAGGSGGSDGAVRGSRREALPLVLPTANHLQLEVQAEGLAALEAIQGPVAPVIVIGPYRSGKSFLLNQLLGVGCTDGFGVGHTRDTQTKGVWVWGEPMASQSQPGTSLVFLDTEGLESTRRIDTYDDRIFAFSAVVSSLLIYNLAETIRESDVSKLSFATQLGKEFLADQESGGAQLQPSSMLWLIQRDFLAGKSVQEMLWEAMQEVPNPGNDPEISAVNEVRQSLKALAGESTAFGLSQPHLNRTQLCELEDSQLAPEYVRQREELRGLVHKLAAPKVLRGSEMHGPQLAVLIRQVVKILNTHKVPTVHNVIESYNADVMGRCVKGYAFYMDSVRIPVDESTLEAAHQQGLQAALKLFKSERFGKRPGLLPETAVKSGGGADPLLQQLEDAVEREHQAHITANKLKSSQACERLELVCEEALEALQGMRLPSERKFEHEGARCRESFEAGCIGPSVLQYSERLTKAHDRARRQFLNDYNNRLFQGMVIFALVMIAVFRFLVSIPPLELAGWVLFLGLEGCGQLGLAGEVLYQSRAWRVLLYAWETLIYNPLMDLERHWMVALALALLAWVAWKTRSRRLRGRGTRKKAAYESLSARDLDV